MQFAVSAQVEIKKDKTKNGNLQLLEKIKLLD